MASSNRLDSVTSHADRVYHILGVPLRTGSFMPGSEHDAQPYRDVGLLARLHAAGCRAIDDGDVAIPSYLPHHQIPPIRNWPGPRIAWELVAAHLSPLLAQPGHVPLLIGCDCSIVVGSTQAVMRAGEDVHLIYVDGDCDDDPPHADRVSSAAALAIWLATHGEPFRAGAPLPVENVSILGWTNPSAAGPDAGGMHAYSLADIRRIGLAATARRVLDAIPATASIVLHFDIDVMAQRDMPAAYFMHDEGLNLTETTDLLGALLRDPRMRVIEVAEYASLRDTDHRYVTQLVDILAHGLGRSPGATPVGQNMR